MEKFFMRFYTTKEQSKRLVDMGVDIRTADMKYLYYGADRYADIPSIGSVEERTGVCDIPCWSSGALLGLLCNYSMDVSEDRHYRLHCNQHFTEWYENLVDACMSMIKFMIAKENTLKITFEPAVV